MKKMKKLAALLLALVMVVGLLAACGGSGDSGSNSGGNSGGNNAQQPSGGNNAQQPSGGGDAQEDVTIKMAFWDYSENEAAQELVAAFEKKYSNIHVEVLDSLAADYVQKLNVLLNGNADVDVVFIKEADGLKAFVDRGQLAPMDEFIAADGTDLSVFNGLADNYKFDGKQYSLPYRSDWYVMYYNKDLFDAKGVAYPSNDWTWEDFERIAGQVTDPATGAVGCFFHSWNACVQNWGVQDGKHTIMSYEDGYTFFKPYYEMVLRMQDAGSCVSFGDIQAGGLHYSSAFAQGNVAMMPMGTWQMATIARQIRNGESKVVNWGVATIPHASDVPVGYSVGSTTPVAICATSAHKEAAWKLVDFVCGEEGAKINVSHGVIPGMVNDSVRAEIAGLDGMPDGLNESLKVANISLDRPCVDHVVEVNQILNQEHQLIMLGEVSVDDGLAEMTSRVAEEMK